MQTIASKKISRATAENIAKTLRGMGENVTTRFDLVELIAASHSLSEELRGFRPDSTSGRRDACHAYMRKLPKDESAALLQVKKDASEALQEPDLLDCFVRAKASRQAAAELEAEADRVEQEAATKRHMEAARMAGAMKRERENDAWNRNWPAEIAAKKLEIETVFTDLVHNWDSPQLNSRLRAAQMDLVCLKNLQEIAEERAKRS